MITIFREKLSSDDSSLIDELARRFVCKNYDDERIIFPQWGSGVTLKMLRRAIRPLLIRSFNKQLCEYATSCKDFDLLAFKAPGLTEETCKLLKKNGGKIAIYNPDLSLYSPNNNMFKVVPYADIYFSTKRDFYKNFLKPAGFTGRFYYLKPHFNAALKTENLSEIKIRNNVVGFLGNYSKGKAKYIDFLRRNSNNAIEIIGDGWGGKLQGVKLFGPIYGPSAFKIAQTWEVSLGLLQESNRHHQQGDQITIRSIEQPAAGMFMIHEANTHIEEIYSDHLLYFSDCESLLKVVKYAQSLSQESQLNYRTEANRIAIGLGLSSVDRATEIASILESISYEKN